MKTRNRRRMTLIAMALMMAFMLGCDEDGDEANGDEEAAEDEEASQVDGAGSDAIENPVTFTISGALEGEREGEALIYAGVAADDFQNFTFESRDEPKFELSFTPIPPEIEDTDVPPPGEYVVGHQGDFSAQYTEGGWSDERSFSIPALETSAGTLVITESEDDFVSGTFEVRLTGGDEHLEITDGEFTAEWDSFAHY